MDDATSAKVSIAVDEAVTNVIVHAYGGEADHLVDIELRFLPQSPGGAHPPHRPAASGRTRWCCPIPGNTCKHPRKGGLGLLLMSRFMDEIRFIETGGGSECCMIKRVV